MKKMLAMLLAMLLAAGMLAGTAGAVKKKVSSTVPFVSGRKPDTEETSKQKKL